MVFSDTKDLMEAFYLDRLALLDESCPKFPVTERGAKLTNFGER